MPRKLDRMRLARDLADAIRGAWEDLQDLAKGERLYSFCLETDGEVRGVLSTANSEEGLDLAARRHAELNGCDFELSRRTLRWSPADWAYREIATERFHAINELLEELVGDQWDESSGWSGMRFWLSLVWRVVLPFGVERRVLSTLETVLREFMNDRPFLRGSLIAFLIHGRSNQALVESARSICGTAAAERLRSELEDAHEPSTLPSRPT